MSEDLKVKEWAVQQGFYWTDNLGSFQIKLKEKPFDYLFSIFNKFILSQAILETPQRLAINCHDGPLPKYAGTNSTSWAILNGETYHGISWHIASEKVDAGDVLQQTIFPIDPNETALSLNLKCYENARTEFARLVNKLLDGSLVPLKQNLHNRSFFHSNKKPAGNAFIGWDSSAEEIVSLYRALDFGEYPNPLALAKFIFGETIIIPKRISILTLSTLPSGTVIKIDKESIEVATKTHNILLTHCVNLTGHSINFEQLATSCNLQVGSLLISLASTAIQQIDKISFECARHEASWVKKFTQITSTSQPFADQTNADRQGASNIIDFSTVIQSAGLLELENKTNPHMSLLTIFLIYLYRLNVHQNLSLYFSNKRFKDLSLESHQAFAGFVPLSTDFKTETNFEQALQSVSAIVDNLTKHGTYAMDIFCRYAALKNSHRLSWAIDIAEDLNNYQTNDLSSVIIAMNREGTQFRIFSNHTLIYPDTQMLANTIAEHLHGLIKAIGTDPKKLISHLDFMSVAELAQLHTQWNQTTQIFPNNKTIAQIFEEQVLKTPHRIAICSADQALTYHEVNVKVNQLAHYLKNLFTTPETLIALYLDRSVDIVISILAILKAGGAYVPVDINHPKAYIQNILNNTPIILTHQKHAKCLQACFSEKNQAHVVDLDEMASAIQKGKTTNPQCELSSKNLAYVIHTSGSTGMPKGVLVEHRSVVNFAYSQIRTCRITENSCVLAFASVSFDASVFEIFCSLFSGAKLYIAKKEEIMPGEPLLHTLRKNKISVALITPIALDLTEPSNLPNLKTLISAGDACSLKINNQWNRKGILFINAYGPTETTVFATLKICPAKPIIPNIGKPIANAVVYVLDQYYQPVPIGVVGELYIGGVGVARGYLNQPELSQQKFIPNPFVNNASDPNQILYRTGDLVRWSPEGDIEYRGRIDAQVKIRGYRIELSAIQSVVQTYPLVKQSVIISLLDAREHRYIAAYIVPIESEQNFDLSALRKYLADKIPPYMVPQSFVILDKLPVNANGKVDKKALPYPKKRLFLTDATYVPPETEVQAELVQVWSQVLNIEKVGIHDNFFNLGGHSLLVTEVLLQVKHAFKINISLKNFFDEPTISQLSKLISNSHTNQISQDAESAVYLKDSVLPAETLFTAIPSVGNKELGSILLTGSTGFLGSHLLYDLHCLTHAKIICLIRAEDYGAALFRINKNLIKYGFRKLINSDRIVFLLGDLSQKNLGLSEEVFNTLSEEVDAIYHSGAVVNHIYDFESLKKTNVDSTLDVIRLAATGKQKKLHFISALNAAVDTADQPTIKEDFLAEHTAPLDLHNGYCQTKWVSEKLLSQAKDHGLLVNIYRPSWISGQIKTGIWEADNNHLLNFIKSCIQLGYAPDKDFSLEMWPVDCISKAIIQISLKGPQESGVYNFTNPNTPNWHDLVAWLNQNGHPLMFASVPEWRSHCFEHMTKANALYPFAALYLQDTDWLSGLSKEKTPKIESHHTAAVLKSVGIQYPNIDLAVLKVYFDYLHKINFIQTASMRQLETCA